MNLGRIHLPWHGRNDCLSAHFLLKCCHFIRFYRHERRCKNHERSSKKARIWQKGQFSIHISFKNKMRICILVHILYQNAEINFLKALACDEFIRPKCFQSPCPIYPLKFLLESYFKFIHTPLNLFVLKVMTYRLGHASGKK